MSKALTTFVILNVVASLAIVSLGTLSFLERKVVKAQTLELEATVQALSEQLQWGEDVAWETPEEKKPLPFSLPQPARPEDLSSLESALSDLVRFTNQRQAQLSLRHGELVSAETALKEVRENLVTRERELQAAQNQQARLTRSLEEAKGDLQTVEAETAKDRAAQARLENELAEKNTQITTMNNELASLEIDLETRIQERDLAQKEYDICRVGAAGTQNGQASGEIKGKRATILAVNPDWQYVVIDKGMIHNVEMDLQAFVHRGKEYVGKLKIVRVEDSLAIAQILPGSVVATDGIRAGDTLFF